MVQVEGNGILGGLRSSHGLLLYWVLLLASPLLAFRIKKQGGRVRWLAGFICIVGLSTYKTIIVLKVLDWNAALLSFRILLLGVTSLWECSNAVLLFGGDPLLDRFNIHSYQQALVAATIPCQVKFCEAVQWTRTLKTTIFVVLMALSGWLLARFLQGNAVLLPIVQARVMLEAEVIAFLTASYVMLLNTPGLLCQWIADALYLVTRLPMFRLRVVMPYGAIYCSKSARDFWWKWSRPAGQLIRHMVYQPLQGRRFYMITVPVLFILNAAMHFDVGHALVGDRAMKWWLLVFGLLGANAVLEMAGDNAIRRHYADSAPVWYAVLRRMIAHTVLCAAGFIFLHRCLKLKLDDLLSLQLAVFVCI